MCNKYTLIVIFRHHSGDYSVAIQMYTDTLVLEVTDSEMVKTLYKRALCFTKMELYDLCIQVLP